MRVHVRGTWVPCHHAAKHWRNRSQDRRDVHRPHHQHGLGRRSRRQLRPDQLRHRQGRHRRAHPDAVTRAVQHRRHRQRDRARRRATRITGTMPNAPQVIEPDDVPDDEWNPMDPSVSSPVVAWLASDESQTRHRSGDPGRRREHHPDGGLDRRRRPSTTAASAGTRRSSASSSPPTSSRPRPAL